MTETTPSQEEAAEKPAKTRGGTGSPLLRMLTAFALLAVGFVVGRLTAPVERPAAPLQARVPAAAIRKPPLEPPATVPQVEAPKQTDDNGTVTLSGVVVDERGNALAQASVSIAGPPPRLANTEEPGNQTVPGELGVTEGPVPPIPVGEQLGAALGPVLSSTDAQGRFSVAGAMRGSLQVIVSKSGFAARVVSVEAPPLGNPAPLRVTLREAGTVEGSIVDQTQKPLANALVVGRTDDGLTLTAMTDASGAFKLLNVLGKLHAEAYAASHTKQACDVEVVARGVSRCDFVLPEEASAQEAAGGGRIAGYVIDVLGRPVAGAHVWTDQGDATTTTNDAGEFLLAGVTPRALVVLAEESSAGSGQSAQVRARAEETLSEVRIYLPQRFAFGSSPSTATPKKPAAKTSSSASSAVDSSLALELRGGKVVVALVARADSESGLKVGDVLDQVDGEDVLSLAQARGMLRDPAGTTASVRVRRGNRSVVARFRRRAMPSL